MSHKMILLSFLICQSMNALTRGEEHTLIMNNLKANGAYVKVCLALKKQGAVITQRDKTACENAYRLYLTMLAAYFDFLEKS